MSLSQKGYYGENRAGKYLEKNGFIIIGKNFRSKFGEIDLIAKKDGSYYFCEVKTRWNTRHGYPEEAVTKYKLEKIIMTIPHFLTANRLKNIKYKIIVVAQIIKGKNVVYQKIINYD